VKCRNIVKTRIHASVSARKPQGPRVAHYRLTALMGAWVLFCAPTAVRTEGRTMSRKAVSNPEEDALEFLHDLLNWPELTGPFSYGPMEDPTRLVLHCHLAGAIDAENAIGPQVEAELRRLSRLLRDEAARVANEWKAAESRRALVASRR
jgi:hypothetical protein